MNLILCFVWQVSGVAFDPFWKPPASDDTADAVMYRFGSVGQVLLHKIYWFGFSTSEGRKLISLWYLT